MVAPVWARANFFLVPVWSVEPPSIGVVPAGALALAEALAGELAVALAVVDSEALMLSVTPARRRGSAAQVRMGTFLMLIIIILIR